MQRKYDFSVSYRNSIGLDKFKHRKTLKERVAKQMRAAALMNKVTSSLAAASRDDAEMVAVAEGGLTPSYAACASVAAAAAASLFALVQRLPEPLIDCLPKVGH